MNLPIWPHRKGSGWMDSTVTGDCERELPFREMLRASPQGQICETAHVFFTLSQNTCSRSMMRRGHQELSSFYSENRMVTLARVITFHVIWVSPVSITFLFGGENSTFRLTTSTSIKVTRRNTMPGGLNPNTLSPICLLSVNSDLHECVGVHIYLTIYTLYYITKKILGNLENHLNVRRLYDLKMG